MTTRNGDSRAELPARLEGLTQRVLELEAREDEQREFVAQLESELRFNKFAIDNLSDAVYFVEEDARIAYVNQAATRMLGYTEQELLAMRVYEIDPAQNEGSWPTIWHMLKNAGKRTMEAEHRCKSGEMMPVEIAANFLEFKGREYSVAFARDIRDRKQLEYRLRQEEKMAAIGQLAGGIAHDFNNQLMGIMGYAEILRMRVAGTAENETLAHSIMQSVARASELTNQLLAFSRKGKYVSEPVDVHRVLKEVTDVLVHSIDKKVRVSSDLAAPRATVLGDSSQLQSALLNLALNARDAMPEGGELSFVSRAITVRTPFQCNPPFEVTPGEYLCVGVRDTGSGIPAAIRHRIFEPFFTTKRSGQGTGLGLAAVYGTVRNHRGAINLRETSEEGTHIEVYLPLCDEEAEAPMATAESEVAAFQESRRVLLVEDEPFLRDITSRMLESTGYVVITFEGGEEALNYYEAHAHEVDLVILDMVMPVMNGREVFNAMKRINPDVKAVIASGYSLDGEAQAAMDEGVKGFIQKPYTRAALGEQLRSIFDTKR
jgi:two-component system, cell cycle sensor histidine kinase and response regulator CckA